MSKTENVKNPDAPLVDGVEVLAQALMDLVDLLDEDRCRDWLFDVVRPGEMGKVCPLCSEPMGERRLKTYRALKKTSCQSCHNQYSATKNTIFHGCHLTPSELVVMSALIKVGANPATIATAIGKSEDTARVWIAKLNNDKVRHG